MYILSHLKNELCKKKKTNSEMIDIIKIQW